MDTESKLNVHDPFTILPECLMTVLCTFNLRPVSRENWLIIQPNWLFNDQCSRHIETSQLICSSNQLTGRYVMGTFVVKVLYNQSNLNDFLGMVISHEVLCESSSRKLHNDSQDLLFIIPFQPSVVFHIETSHLFYSAKHMTNFYVKRNAGLMGVGTFSIGSCFAFLGTF